MILLIVVSRRILFVYTEFDIIASHYWTIWHLKYFTVPVMDSWNLTNLILGAFHSVAFLIEFIFDTFFKLIFLLIRNSSVKMRFLHSRLRDLLALIYMSSWRWVRIGSLLFLRFEGLVFRDHHGRTWIIN